MQDGVIAGLGMTAVLSAGFRPCGRALLGLCVAPGQGKTEEKKGYKNSQETQQNNLRSIGRGPLGTCATGAQSIIAVTINMISPIPSSSDATVA